MKTFAICPILPYGGTNHVVRAYGKVLVAGHGQQQVEAWVAPPSYKVDTAPRWAVQGEWGSAEEAAHAIAQAKHLRDELFGKKVLEDGSLETKNAIVSVWESRVELISEGHIYLVSELQILTHMLLP